MSVLEASVGHRLGIGSKDDTILGRAQAFRATMNGQHIRTHMKPMFSFL